MRFRTLIVALAIAALAGASAVAVAQRETVAVVEPTAFEENVASAPARVPEPAALVALFGAGALLVVLARNRTIFTRD